MEQIVIFLFMVQKLLNLKQKILALWQPYYAYHNTISLSRQKIGQKIIREKVDLLVMFMISVLVMMLLMLMGY